MVIPQLPRCSHLALYGLRGSLADATHTFVYRCHTLHVDFTDWPTLPQLLVTFVVTGCSRTVTLTVGLRCRDPTVMDYVDLPSRIQPLTLIHLILRDVAPLPALFPTRSPHVAVDLPGSYDCGGPASTTVAGDAVTTHTFWTTVTLRFTLLYGTLPHSLTFTTVDCGYTRTLNLRVPVVVTRVRWTLLQTHPLLAFSHAPLPHHGGGCYNCCNHVVLPADYVVGWLVDLRVYPDGYLRCVVALVALRCQLRQRLRLFDLQHLHTTFIR